MSRKLGVGVIGCGNISAAYMRLAPLFRGIEMRACADVLETAAKARAEEFKLRQETVEGLLKADDVDIVVNLTVPAAHYEISRQAIEAGKHVYSEKPFVLSVEEGKALAELAAKKGVRVGSAPDTFLGGSHQLARSVVDSGAIGKVVSGTCHVMSHGMEHWHPSPDFFFKPGAGPVLDVGPYYVTNLIQLIGPVRRVGAAASIPTKERIILSEPRRGEKIIVETPTTIHAILEFESGAIITLGASWDVWHHKHSNMELYGEKGSLHVPDPNFFGGDLVVTDQERITDVPQWDHPLGVANQESKDGRRLANYRTAGLADMALAILENRPHRCSLEMSLHAIDVMTSILKAAEKGSFLTLSTTCERPAALDPAAARGLLEEKVLA